jgi:hypothetical protein
MDNPFGWLLFALALERQPLNDQPPMIDRGVQNLGGPSSAEKEFGPQVATRSFRKFQEQPRSLRD